jgi:hypothetical protein
METEQDGSGCMEVNGIRGVWNRTSPLHLYRLSFK